MADTHVQQSPAARRLRVWPGVVILALVLLVRFGAPLVLPEAGAIGVIAGLAGMVAIIIWWVFFSRAAWVERIGALILIAVATLVTRFLVDPSISGGLMGRMFYVYALPITVPPLFVAWAVATRRLSDPVRRATMVVAILIACGLWVLVRTEGVSGKSIADFEWRWTPTAEERLLAQVKDEPAPPPATSPASEPAKAAEPPKATASAPAAEKQPVDKAAETRAPADPAESTKPPAAPPVAAVAPAAWPGFRGPRRDGVIRGVTLETDWSKAPPAELWRRPIGPGWSSFAVAGEFIYTQEQRGEEEMVSCYRLATGEPVWRHRDRARFYESNGGPGPRATPTVHGGRVYSLGATGILNALDARTGSVIWSRNAATDTGAKMPGWGFTGSPLVVGDLLIVATSGRLVGYDLASGNPRWTRTTRGGGYSSPHLANLGGVAQILLLSGDGITSVTPNDGNVLWAHSWQDAAAIVQPVVLSDSDLLITSADAMGGQGMRRLRVSREQSGWKVEERWTSRGLKPYYNDYVVHEGHAFGFDGTILSCIDIETGERKWKGGRYGAGQMMLLPAQDLLLVVSEEGELALVSATPDKHTELARFKAIEGKTWNHPVLVGDELLVRNGEEMAAFRLTTVSR